jgi:type IV secretory pathway protease TraF
MFELQTPKAARRVISLSKKHIDPLVSKINPIGTYRIDRAPLDNDDQVIPCLK